MSEREFVVTCSVCGKQLFKSDLQTGCAIDVQCGKCGSYLSIKHNMNLLSVKETSGEYTASVQKHV